MNTVISYPKNISQTNQILKTAKNNGYEAFRIPNKNNEVLEEVNDFLFGLHMKQVKTGESVNLDTLIKNLKK